MSYKLRDKVWVRVDAWNNVTQQRIETWTKGKVVGVAEPDYLVRIRGVGVRRRSDSGLRAR